MMSASDVGVLVIGQGTALNLDGIGIEEEEEVVDGDHHLQGEEDLDHALGIGGDAAEVALGTGDDAADPGNVVEAEVVLMTDVGEVDQGTENLEVAAGIGRVAQEIAKTVDLVANPGLDPNLPGGLDPNLHVVPSLNLQVVQSQNLLDVPNLSQSLHADQGLYRSQKVVLAAPLSLNRIRLMEMLTQMKLKNNLKKKMVMKTDILVVKAWIDFCSSLILYLLFWMLRTICLKHSNDQSKLLLHLYNKSRKVGSERYILD